MKEQYEQVKNWIESNQEQLKFITNFKNANLYRNWKINDKRRDVLDTIDWFFEVYKLNGLEEPILFGDIHLTLNDISTIVKDKLLRINKEIRIDDVYNYDLHKNATSKLFLDIISFFENLNEDIIKIINEERYDEYFLGIDVQGGDLRLMDDINLDLFIYNYVKYTLCLPDDKIRNKYSIIIDIELTTEFLNSLVEDLKNFESKRIKDTFNDYIINAIYFARNNNTFLDKIEALQKLIND